jgi:hypothetical protein
VNGLGRWRFGNIVQDGGWEEGDVSVSEHLVEAVDMVVGDMRLTTLMAR